MNIDDMKLYIYNNINNISDNKYILIKEYIYKNKLKHTLNNNGIFINLSLCDDNNINFFYDIIMKDDINENLNKNFQIEKEEINSNIDNYKNEEEEKEDIIIKNYKLTNIEKQILSYSFK